EDAEDDAEQPGGDRAPAEAGHAARGRPDAGRDREQPDQDRQQNGPRGERRQREPERERAEEDADDADRLRRLPLDAGEPGGHRRHARLLLRTPATIVVRFRPTNRITSPWMIVVRLPARSGRKIDGSSWRPEVPLSSAPNSSDAAPTPIAVLRPSSAAASPMNPI